MPKKFPPKIVTLLLMIVLVLAVMVMGIAGLYYYQAGQAANSQTQQQVKFVIPKGQAISIIAQRLAEEGLIKNALVFRLIVKQQQLEDKIQAGSFDLSANMTARQIAQTLTQGTNDVWLTIPEGWRREEIAQSLVTLDLPDFDQQEFLTLTLNLEGKLFPDSYLIPKMISTQAVVNLLTNTFEKKVTLGLANEIKQAENNQLLLEAGVSPQQNFNQILVMASILEREAKGYQQMRQVAGVLWNRLIIGMPLQVDASLQYIKGYNAQLDDWWSPPLAADKELKSAFNTYQNAQLPPAPICSPGLDAIKAALDPLDSDYLFYLHDSQGVIHFAKTAEQHNQNVNSYLR